MAPKDPRKAEKTRKNAGKNADPACRAWHRDAASGAARPGGRCRWKNGEKPCGCVVDNISRPVPHARLAATGGGTAGPCGTGLVGTARQLTD